VTAIFITATGPDVGRTLVVASLIRHFRQSGRAVDAIKPIVSGYDPAQAAASETGMLVSALGLPFTPESIDRISPWRFRAALSPDLAARQEGRSIDVDGVVAYCQSAIDRRRDILLIDGIGGIMAPLDETRTILDVMMALRLPLILVALREKMDLQHCLQRAFEVEQCVQQERQQQGAAAPAHPPEKEPDNENLQDPGPVVLHVQRRP
jgi:dethiobiotin synthetase